MSDAAQKSGKITTAALSLAGGPGNRGSRRLDPAFSAAGSAGRIHALRHDTLQAHAAGRGEHRCAVRLDVFVESDAARPARIASPASLCAR